jgi:hypothetical protein
LRWIAIIGLLFVLFAIRSAVPPLGELVALPPGQPYNKTAFEFRYGHALRTVLDPHNQMQWCYGGLPNSVTVKDKVRHIVFNAPGATIKSRTDSIEVLDDTVHYRGYMGIWSKEAVFLVDRNGAVNPAPP